MYLKYSTAYLSGVVEMASSYSKYMGPSYMTAICFDLKNPLEDFKRFYDIKEDIKVNKVETSYHELLITLLGNDKDLIDTVEHWTRVRIGEVQEIYTIEENSNLLNLLSGSDGGLSPFYIVDDIYFVKFNKMFVVFMIGNDE